ncbi:MAG: hypothetical protein A3D64_00405 [Candidatus Wildermuthbacteria bacterium RIFCSPHIGHO2_02_FULL_49_9]|nr:MAG: hypothetical protein A3D64_00405 [Candidatus Wildermuthbacteria bacterium RIFCSPHIGHO2_02_FULL_49_9]
MGRLLLSFRSWFRFSRKTENEEKSVSTSAKAEGLSSPEDLGVLVSAGESKPKRPNFFDDETIEFKETVGLTLLFRECGHHGPEGFMFNIWGNSKSLKTAPTRITRENGQAHAEGVCPKCYFEQLKQAAIRCCLCGYAILPGDGVALYHKNSKGINKAVITLVDDNAIGCLLWDCCPSGGFYGGHWTAEGFQPGFAGGTMAAEALRSGEPVVTTV